MWKDFSHSIPPDYHFSENSPLSHLPIRSPPISHLVIYSYGNSQSLTGEKLGQFGTLIAFTRLEIRASLGLSWR
jgi:hypothetical protein